MSLKISLPNVDVKSAGPEQLAVNSDNDTLKLVMDNTTPYFGEILVNFIDNPGPGTYPLLTYKHRFNYVPFYYIFFDIAKSTKILGTNTGVETGTIFRNDAAGNQEFLVTDTKDGFTFNYVVVDNSGFDMTNSSFSFRYFVYANDGVNY